MMFFGIKKNKKNTIQDVKLLYSKGNYKSALAACKKYLENNKDDFDATNLLGDIYFKMGDKTKSLEIFKKLAASMEEDKYINRAIAVTKKIIRLFPEQYDLYRKLSNLFEKKNIKAEQLNVLYDLADIYEQKGLDDKAIDILKEIAEIDRNSISNYKKIINKLNQFGKKYDVCKFMYYCVELAHKNKDYASLEYFCEIAIESECDFKTFLKFTVEYFRKNEDKKELFIKYAEEALLDEFNDDIFSYYSNLVKVESNFEFYEQLKVKYKNYPIYLLILSYLIDNNSDKFKQTIKEINELPDFEFKNELAKLAEDFYDKVEEVEILDSLVVLAAKGNLKDLQIKIYKKLAKIYKDNNEITKADSIEKYINELSYSGYGVDTAIDNFDSDTTDISENVIEIDDDLEYGEIDLDLDLLSDDKADEQNEDGVIELDLDSELELPDNSESTIESNNTENVENDFDIEINLDDFESENVVNDEEEKIDDLLEVDLDQEDIFADDKQESTLNEQIKYVESLIQNKKIDEAKAEVDQLIMLYPDNEEIKDIAASLILAEGESSVVKEIEKSEVSDLVTNEFKKLADSIRQSINEQVSEDDYETHYDLAIAYMEMELFEDAVNELKKSATGAKKYESLFLLAECYKRMGLLDDAINIHKLIVVDYEEQEKLLNSLYEIGLILELKGDISSSNKYFEKVYKLNPDFRDIKTKYKEEKLIDEPIDNAKNKEGEGGKKKKKISFL